MTRKAMHALSGRGTQQVKSLETIMAMEVLLNQKVKLRADGRLGHLRPIRSREET